MRRLKKSAVYGLYATSIALVLGGIVTLGVLNNNTEKEETDYVSKGINDYETEVEVVNTTPTLIKPFVEENIEVVKSYYDYQADADAQEKSLIYYEGTYMQSSGVSYSNGNTFDVVTVLSGTVKEVKEDETLGNTISILHDNNIMSVYQSVSDIAVKEGDTVTQGQVIAKSSTSNISKDLNNHLYFELMVNNVSVNPENYYNKSIDELGA